jgi:hypothetical protein
MSTNASVKEEAILHESESLDRAQRQGAERLHHELSRF